MLDPYTGGATSELARLQTADQRIRFVITVFKGVGWFFVILFSTPTILALPFSIHFMLTHQGESIGTAMLSAAIILLFAAVPISALRIAKRMQNYDPTARRPAMALCVLSLPVAFPVALFLLRRISANYDDYCRLGEALLVRDDSSEQDFSAQDESS